MCTIGAVLNKDLIIFKNCDLKNDTFFYKPKIKIGKYRYLAMTRKGRPGCWAGVNEFGLGIVAADTYTKKKYIARPETSPDIFRGYEKTISNYKNVDEAITFLKSYYRSKIKVVPDMLILGDRKKIAAFEFSPPNKFGIGVKTKGFVLRTNQFKILKGGKGKKEDPESYSRFINASDFIKKGSITDIKNLCCDHQDGPSRFSICRHGIEEEYRTMASVIMVIGDKIKINYVLNSKPCRKKYKEIELRKF